MFPGKFKVKSLKDRGVTGRLEVTMAFMSQGSEAPKSVLIWSKKNGDRFPSERWFAFEAKAREAVT